jgi:hypothetical protein
MIGLSGAHRTGKTTLARTFAERRNLLFLRTSATGTFERLGLDPKKDYSFGQRLSIQNEILKDFEKVYRSAGRPFVADRTPLDTLAYMVADVQRENVTELESKELEAYIKECYRVLNAYFPIVVIVQPGIPIVEEAGKAPGLMAYIEHINSLVLGFMVDERYSGEHYFIPRRRTDMEERISCLDYARARSVEKHELWLVAQKDAGREVMFS